MREGRENCAVFRSDARTVSHSMLAWNFDARFAAETNVSSECNKEIFSISHRGRREAAFSAISLSNGTFVRRSSRT